MASPAMIPDKPRGDEIVRVEYPEIRRFGLADLTSHGGWVLARLLKAWPLHSEKSLAGWLRGLIDDRGTLFLASERAVALAQVTSHNSLEAKPQIFERFVLAQDRENPAHVDEAAQMYHEFARWRASQGLDVIVVDEGMCDVPIEKIRAILGPISKRDMVYSKLKRQG